MQRKDWTSLQVPNDIQEKPKPRFPSVKYGTQKVVTGILGVGLLIIFVNIHWLRQMQSEHMQMHPAGMQHGKQPVVWIHGKRLESGYLDHVFNVFKRVGYRFGDKDSDWDVLWSHDYPFVQLQTMMHNLKPHQRVNKFPGSGFITNKVSLATSDIKYIPKAFKIPKDKESFFIYAKVHPSTQWVQKSNNHRGIKILSLEDLDMKAENTFIQEYIGDPFLIDGRRFDIGVYAVLTSIDPIRVYIYEGDWLLRFCPEQYQPFDPAKLDKYVVGDDYMPTWKVPSLKDIYEAQHTHKATLLTYINQLDKDDKKLQEDIHDAVMGVYLDKESELIKATEKYKSKRNFFEMVRFDFVLDKDLNIFLMEVNMSPNLSSKHFPANKLLYEQVVFGLLSVVGVAHSVTSDTYQRVHQGADSDHDELNMQVSDRDIQADVETCMSAQCKDSCLSQKCKLCHRCLTVEQRAVLKAAYLEHINRHQYTRVFPPQYASQDAARFWSPDEDQNFKNYNAKNQLMVLWFHSKCIMDLSWC